MRGQSTPVLHLGMLLSGDSYEPGRRFVSTRVDDRPVIFEVDETLGVRRLSRTQLETTTSLVHGALTERITTLGVLDGKLLAWLDTARLVQHELLDLVLSEGWT
jgi:chemotaxis signal transduction protein